ncbi:MAG: EVE domain-containing protein [Longimicrobiales bacterium]
MKYWAFLADPEDFGWNEMEKDGSAVWDGVKNAVAQRNLRTCEKGDRIAIYHTSPDKALIGIAKITGVARPDPKAAERVVVDVEPVKKLKRALPLAEMKADDVLAGMSFVKMPRVAVQPLTAAQWTRILELTGTKG